MVQLLIHANGGLAKPALMLGHGCWWSFKNCATKQKAYVQHDGQTHQCHLLISDTIWRIQFGVYENCGLCMHRGCRERFPRHRLKSKPLVSDPGMHHGTCVTHVPWCISGSLTRGGGENVPDIPGACATRNLTYLARGPYSWVHTMIIINLWYPPFYKKKL